MPGKVNIDGTNYKNIVYGKINVDGTNYKNINYGKVGLSGGGYGTISFGSVPKGYQQVQYIENTSTATTSKPYYLLPILSQENLVLDLFLETSGYTETQCKIGTGNVTSAQIQQYALEDDGESFYYGVASCSGTSVTTGLPASGLNKLVHVVFGNYGVSNQISITSRNRTNSNTRTQSLSSGQPMYLMSPNGPMRGKYGLIVAYNGSALIMKLYPCVRTSDNVPGFWDYVSKTFLTKQGTGGTIVAGSDYDWDEIY